MLDPQLQRFVEEDLYNEIRWLLVAASSWTVKDVDQPAAHFRVMCMDSALLHARNLLEFFTMRFKQHERVTRQEKFPASCHSFGVAAARSPFYETWRTALEARLMHLRTDRPWPRAKGSELAQTAIKHQVLNFAKEVLRLWDEFAMDPGVAAYERILYQAREGAIADAAYAARTLGITPPLD